MNLEKPEESTFTIQNYKTKFEDLFERIVAASEQMKTSGYLYNRVVGAFGSNMTLAGNLLQKSIDEANLIWSSGVGNNVSFGEHGILTETAGPYPNGVTGQTWIAGGHILLSNSINADGDRIWSSAITPLGINATLIKTGRLDTERVNIYSGDQLRFAWKADGLFAYKGAGADTLYDTYVRYNEDGLLFYENGARAVELGWNGLYIGSQNGSVELTGDKGLEIYNAETPRQLLVKLGGFGFPIDGVYPEYGMKFYKTIDNEHIETLVSTNEGQLWLRDSLMVGARGNEGFVGITGSGVFGPENDPIRIWAGHLSPSFAPFYVTHKGNLFASNAIISGTITATSGYIGGLSGWLIGANRIYSGDGTSRVELNSDINNDYAIWAGANVPTLNGEHVAPFSITRAGLLYASDGEIAGNFTVSGALGTPQFASGALGNGWRIDGSSGYAEV